MHFAELVPSVFYKDLSDGLKLFVECLQFKVLSPNLLQACSLPITGWLK